MTSKEFRSIPKKVSEWAKVLDMPITQEVLQILRDEGPEFDHLGGIIGASEVDIKVEFGRGRGFALHHRQMEQMAEKIPLKKAKPEPTYEEDKD